MPRKPDVPQVDPEALAAFQAGLRRRFSDEQLLDELRASARRLGRSPTMKEFAADPGAGVHPQTVIEHFGTWNTAKRAAGLLPRRFVTREELLTALRSLGEELGRTPTVVEIKRRRGTMPSASLYWHTFGSLAAALREAGFDVTLAEERLERAISEGVALSRQLGRLPKFSDWHEARLPDDSLLTEWQVYRLFEARRGAWATFQYLVRERLSDEGVSVEADGSLDGF
jgi:Homing endonuclease associated repeat